MEVRAFPWGFFVHLGSSFRSWSLLCFPSTLPLLGRRCKSGAEGLGAVGSELRTSLSGQVAFLPDGFFFFLCIIGALNPPFRFAFALFVQRCIEGY